MRAAVELAAFEAEQARAENAAAHRVVVHLERVAGGAARADPHLLVLVKALGPRKSLKVGLAVESPL